MSHEQKYLKYKIKYLELLDEMSGGGKHNFKLVEDLIKWLRRKLLDVTKNKDLKHLVSIYVFTPTEFARFANKHPKWNSGYYDEPEGDIKLKRKINLKEYFMIDTNAVVPNQITKDMSTEELTYSKPFSPERINEVIYNEIKLYMDDKDRELLIYLHGKD